MNSLFSIIIPTYNGGKIISRLLKKIASFDSNYSKEVLIIDSSSTDNTLKIVENFKKKIKYLKVINIAKKQFNHGETRNLGVRMVGGKYVCFFSQDATPKSSNILSYYLEDFKRDSKIVAIYGKHVSYEDTPVIQKLEADCFWNMLDSYLDRNGVLVKNLSNPFIPFNEENKSLWYQLSDTSSCYDRQFLLKNRFPKTMYGEDILLGKLIIENGLSIVYDTRCSVYHSHNYSLLDYYKREKESLNLTVKEMSLKKKINIYCKLRAVLKMDISFLKKLYYICKLIIYYILKFIIIVSLLVEKKVKKKL